VNRLTECLSLIETIATLAQEAITSLGEQADYQQVERFVLARAPKSMDIQRIDVLEVTQFLARLAPTVYDKDPSGSGVSISGRVDLSKVDLFSELSWQYSIARNMLETAAAGLSGDEKLKTLSSANRLIEQAVKLKEKLKGLASVEEFESAVFRVLDEAEPALRDRVLDLLEGLGTDTGVASKKSAHQLSDDNALTVDSHVVPGPSPLHVQLGMVFECN